jgi:hypothetical protein
VACLTGVLVILAMTRRFVLRLGSPGSAKLLEVGLLWLFLTVAFEFGFGRLSGASWQALLADYDIPRGRLWPLVLLTTFLAPWLWGRDRRDRRVFQHCR